MVGFIFYFILGIMIGFIVMCILTSLLVFFHILEEKQGWVKKDNKNCLDMFM